jgi:hypothetical protein
MKPRIQRVLTPWKPGFMAFGAGPILKIKLSGIAFELDERGIHA